MTTVAALYVIAGGDYYGLADVDPWDEKRDARLYDGPYPVVAHPPCERWCQLAALNQSLHASRLGDKYRIGNDGGCFEHALRAVRTFGGVLEHPAMSIAWDRYGLPRPARWGWSTTFDDPGYATEIDQWAYGHLARKRTWLYVVGVDELPALRWQKPRGETAQVSSFGHRRPGNEGRMMLDRGKSNPTPPAFRDELLSLARLASVAVAGN